MESTSSLVYILCGEDFAFSYGKVGPKSTFLLWVNSPTSFICAPYCGGVEVL